MQPGHGVHEVEEEGLEILRALMVPGHLGPRTQKTAQQLERVEKHADKL